MTAGRWAAATASPTEAARVRPTLHRRSRPPRLGCDRKNWAAGAAISPETRAHPVHCGRRKDGEPPELRVLTHATAAPPPPHPGRGRPGPRDRLPDRGGDGAYPSRHARRAGPGVLRAPRRALERPPAEHRHEDAERRVQAHDRRDASLSDRGPGAGRDRLLP